MKLRANYGTLEMTKYQIMVMWVYYLEKDLCFDGSLVNGTATGQIATWFEMGRGKKFDVGLDLKLFNNKVSIVTDYFIDTRKDL
jgi:hypothetical protein